MAVWYDCWLVAHDHTDNTNCSQWVVKAEKAEKGEGGRGTFWGGWRNQKGELETDMIKIYYIRMCAYVCIKWLKNQFKTLEMAV